MADAIDSLEEGFALFNSADRLVLFNSTFQEKVDSVAPGALEIGQTFEDLIRCLLKAEAYMIKPVDKELFLRERVESHKNAPSRRVHQHADGRWMEVTERPTTEGGIVLVQHDITERKRAEQALLAEKQIADLANRSKTEFLTNVSHELRTPLNAIIGFADLLQAAPYGELGDCRYGEYAEAIRSSGKQLLGVINDILGYSRVDLGQAVLSEESIDVDGVFDRILSRLRTRAEKSNIELKSNVMCNGNRLFADQRMMMQILFNLAANAVKFTPSGGHVALTADVDESGRFVFRITDDGIGIAREDIDRVMQPFGQADGSTSRNFEGTGLGLPLAKSFTELHGGELKLDSKPDVGTAVTVSLPAERVLTPS